MSAPKCPPRPSTGFHASLTGFLSGAVAAFPDALSCGGDLPPPSANPCALLISGDTRRAAAFADSLEEAGYLVVHAPTVRSARRALRAGQRYALVILDHGLPDGDGRCLVSEIRSCLPGVRLVLALKGAAGNGPAEEAAIRATVRSSLPARRLDA